MNRNTGLTENDWELAEKLLKEAESAYTEIGSAGAICLTMFIMPCRDRFNKGERTMELFVEIMGIKL